MALNISSDSEKSVKCFPLQQVYSHNRSSERLTAAFATQAPSELSIHVPPLKVDSQAETSLLGSESEASDYEDARERARFVAEIQRSIGKIKVDIEIPKIAAAETRTLLYRYRRRPPQPKFVIHHVAEAGRGITGSRRNEAVCDQSQCRTRRQRPEKDKPNQQRNERRKPAPQRKVRVKELVLDGLASVKGPRVPRTCRQLPCNATPCKERVVATQNEAKVAHKSFDIPATTYLTEPPVELPKPNKPPKLAQKKIHRKNRSNHPRPAALRNGHFPTVMYSSGTTTHSPTSVATLSTPFKLPFANVLWKGSNTMTSSPREPEEPLPPVKPVVRSKQSLKPWCGGSGPHGLVEENRKKWRDLAEYYDASVEELCRVYQCSRKYMVSLISGYWNLSLSAKKTATTGTNTGDCPRNVLHELKFTCKFALRATFS